MTAFNGKHCPTCGAEVVVEEDGDRTIYRCPSDADDHSFSHISRGDAAAWEQEPPHD